MRALAFLIFALLALPLRAAPEGGHDVGHGGDFITTENNPWFLGNEPVAYCLRASDDFSSVDSARGAIKAALRDWKATIVLLKPRATTTDLLDGVSRTIATEYHEVACTDPTVRLVFQLGIVDSAVSDVLAHRPTYSVSFARPDDFGADGRTKRGLVWLVPDRGPDAYRGPKNRESFWSHYPTLYNTLLHEIGHVFGFQHQAGVMADTLPADIVASGLDLIYSSRLYVDQRWTRSANRAGGSVCGNVLASSTGIFSRLSGEVVPDGGWLACLEWSKSSSETLVLTLVPQDGGPRRVFPLIKLNEFVARALPEVTGFYPKREQRPGETWPKRHVFIQPYSDVLMARLDAEGTAYSVVVTTTETEIRLSIVDAAHSFAGWVGVYLNQSMQQKQGSALGFFQIPWR